MTQTLITNVTSALQTQLHLPTPRDFPFTLTLPSSPNAAIFVYNDEGVALG